MATADVATVDVAGDGVALFYGSIVLLVLSWTIFCMRVGVRVWRKAFGLDDYIMFVGIILFSVTAALCIVCCYYGSGQFSRDLPPLTMSKGIKLFYVAEYFYASGAMFIKISVAVTLLRIAVGRPVLKWIIWGLIGATVIAAIVFIAGIANICHPIETLWGMANGTCNLQLNTDVSLFFSAIEILTDFSLSLLPAILLWNVQMKGKVKGSVAVMLALASFASCATIVRLNFLTLYSDPGEFMYSTGKIGFWSLVEEGIGIIAGSLPALRPLLNLRIRITSSSNTPAPSGNAYASNQHSKQLSSRAHIMMDTFQVLGDDADHDDADSQKNIIKETNYTVTSTRVEPKQSREIWDDKSASHV